MCVGMLAKLSKIMLLVMLVLAFGSAGSGSTPFLASAVKADASVLFEEDFSNAQPTDWTISSTGSVSNGALHIGSWSNFQEQAIYGGQTFTGPYSFSTDVTALASSGNWNATRILFNVQDDNNRYELIIGNMNNAVESNVELVKKVNGTDTTLANNINYPLSKAATTLQVVVDNGTISVYALQGGTVTTIIDHVSDNAFNSGQIGIGTRSSLVDFDNVRVVDGVDIIAPPEPPASLPVPTMADGNFTVDGTEIVDPDGERFISKGVNVNGPRWPWLRDTIQDADLITNVWQFNTVRVNMFPKMEHWNIAGNMDLDGIVETFTSRHVVTMIEDHDFTGSYPAATGITNGDGSYSMSLDEISAYWVNLANQYKDNPYVWFNLMNEPGLGGLSVDASSARWKEVHDAIITAIRSTGAQNIIVLDGHNYGQEGGYKNQTNDSAILTNGEYFTGKYSNIVFSLHMYDTWMDGLQRLNTYLDTAAAKGLAVIVGEYGASNNATTSATAAMFNATVPRDVGRIVWSWGSEDGGSDFDLTKKETTTQGAGWEIDHTDGSKPTNLTWMGNLVWEDTHDGLTLPVTTDIPLLVNGNFEAGLSDWLNWSGALVGTDSHGGTQSFHVASGAAGGGGQFVILKPNTTYKLSVWGKVSGTPEGGNAAVGVQYKPTETSPDADQIKQILEFTDTAWTQKEVTFTTGDGAYNANVFIWKAAANVDLFVDDISLSEVPPIVANGGFEGGMDGWMNWSNASAAPEGHTGLQSFSVAAGGAGGGGQYVTVKPNTSYKLTMWGKVSGALEGGSADAGFQYRPTDTSPDEDQIKYFLTFDSTSWTKKEVTFTTGASVAAANVFIWKSAANVELLIDDVQLAEMSSGEVDQPGTDPDPEQQPDGFAIAAVHFHNAAGDEVTELPSGGLMTADVSITRHGAAEAATMVVALYDPNGDIASLSFVTKTMEDEETDTFTGGFNLPANTAGYAVKVMLWNNMQDMTPLADPVVL